MIYACQINDTVLEHVKQSCSMKNILISLIELQYFSCLTLKGRLWFIFKKEFCNNYSGIEEKILVTIMFDALKDVSSIAISNVKC